MYNYIDGTKTSRTFALATNIAQVCVIQLSRTTPKKGSVSAGVEIQRHSVNITLPVKVDSDCSECKTPATISVNLSISAPVLSLAAADTIQQEVDRVYGLIKAQMNFGFLPRADATLVS